MKPWVCSQCHINQAWRCMAVISRSRGRRITSLRSTSTRYQGGVQLGLRIAFENNRSKQAPYVFLYTSLFFFSCKKWSISIFFFKGKKGILWKIPRSPTEKASSQRAKRTEPPLEVTCGGERLSAGRAAPQRLGTPFSAQSRHQGLGLLQLCREREGTGSDKEQKPA